MIDFLNQNTGVLSLFFSAIVAISTVVYAILTWRLTSETKRTRKANTQPKIAIFIEAAGTSISLKDLVIQNIGAGPAYGVQFRIIEDLPSDICHPLASMNLVRNGLPYLAPGQKYQFYYLSIIGRQTVLADRRLRITVSYSADDGESIKEEFVIGFDHFFGMHHVAEQGMPQLFRHMEQLTRDMHSIVSGSGKVHVVVQTEKELEAKYEELRGPTLWTPDNSR